MRRTGTQKAGTMAKFRSGFVSNSSSASFTVPKATLSERQLELIRNHIQYTKDGALWLHSKNPDYIDAWEITEDDFQLRGRTFMDNFDMISFLEWMGVNMEVVKQGEGWFI